MSLVNLGQIIISKTAKLKYRILIPIEELKKKFKISCPSRSEMVKIIKKRNELVDILNKLQKSVLIIDKTIKPLQPILKALNIAITSLKLLPAPTTTPGLTAGNIVLLSDSLSIAKTKVNAFNSQVEAFIQIKQYVLQTIINLKELLKSLDILINICLEKAALADQNNIGGSNFNEQNQTFNNTNIQIDEGLSNIKLTEIDFLNIELNQNENNILQQLESPNNNDVNSYKGFRFAILNDLTSTSKYPKRYAVAKNSSGIVLLRGESSFSSSVQILIDELKFQIDSQDLKSF